MSPLLPPALIGALAIAAAQPSAPAAATPRSGPAATAATAATPAGPAPRPPTARAVVEDGARRARLLAAEGNRAGLAALGADLFDVEELARRSLGARWKRLPAAGRARLVAALRSHLESRFLARLPAAGAPAPPFEVTGTRTRGTEAVVTAVVGAGRAPVELHLRLQGGRWRAHDAVIAGLALLDGYREQLPQLLDLGGVARVEAQLEQERAALEAPAAP